MTIDEIEAIINGKNVDDRRVFDGEALSSGLAFGEVRVVEDPSKATPEKWPENTILVAENTDPGWTPLFAKAKGVIVDKGGVLSHCAIKFFTRQREHGMDPGTRKSCEKC